VAFKVECATYGNEVRAEAACRKPIESITSMHGTLFALTMIAITCATLAILKIFGKRPDRNTVLSGCLLFAITLAVLSYVAFGHLCDRGGPWGAVVLGSVLAGTLRATVETKSIRRWLWIGWFAVTFWGSNICHLDGYVGNPLCGKVLTQRSEDRLRYSQDVLRKASEERKGLVLPEGWIEESWRASTNEDFPAPSTCHPGIVGHYWHTWFTGVFSLETHDCGIWCAGGPLKTCCDSLEIRPRPHER
jgi:hypothetical protein